MLISIVVPVYNNFGTLTKTFDQIQHEFITHLFHHRFEVIFINDGSHDQSQAELLELKSRHSEVKVLKFTRNFGQNAAMAAGNRQAKGDCLINISADLQDPIELMPKMVSKWEEGYKVVACVRQGRDESIFRRVPSNLFYRFLRLSVPSYPKEGFDYFLIDRAVLDIINPYSNRNSFMLLDILDTGYAPFSIPYRRLDRAVGKSGYTFLRRVKALFDNVVNSSYLPIRLMSLFGFVTAFVGFIYACMVAYSRLTGKFDIPGYTPVVCLILITSGVNMLMMGMIGEYLWRAFDEIKRRPDYVIQESLLD